MVGQEDKKKNNNNKLGFKKLCGQSSAVDVELCSQWIKDLPALMEGLFYKYLKDKTFTFKDDSKERIIDRSSQCQYKWHRKISYFQWVSTLSQMV